MTAEIGACYACVDFMEAMLAQIIALAMSDYKQFKLVVARLLGYIDPRQPFGTALFDAFARITVSVAIEGFALRRNSVTEELDVFLRRRALDDTAYPGEWHAPGTILRPGETYNNAFDRLAGEFGTSVLSYLLCDNLNWPQEARGHVLSIIFLVDLIDDPRKDETHCWFSVDRLPQPMVDSHEHHMLPMAIKAFEDRKRQQKGDL